MLDLQDSQHSPYSQSNARGNNILKSTGDHVREANVYILRNTVLSLIFFMIAPTAGLSVRLATLSKISGGAVAMAYLTSNRPDAVNQTHIQMITDIAIPRM